MDSHTQAWSVYGPDGATQELQGTAEDTPQAPRARHHQDWQRAGVSCPVWEDDTFPCLLLCHLHESVFLL